ncbi:unnamed protein product [Schistocephalus solidus]|uniref:Uncharacterized protein n=1 Tax=Schistocephalus solidus TaxID=70667 RepID=A0A3P7CKL9_SCHSO|nr:unnamed protein product [Schistocephalus solidus]
MQFSPLTHVSSIPATPLPKTAVATASGLGYAHAFVWLCVCAVSNIFLPPPPPAVALNQDQSHTISLCTTPPSGAGQQSEGADLDEVKQSLRLVAIALDAHPDAEAASVGKGGTESSASLLLLPPQQHSKPSRPHGVRKFISRPTLRPH